jgi:uncharacterized membrane protein HdeD (DUF308 family)
VTHDDAVTPEQANAIATVWWVPLVLGLLSLVAGVIVLIKPSNSLTVITVVIGIFILLDGVMQVYMGLRHRVENSTMVAVIGVLDLIIGIILVRHPIAGVTAAALLIGIWLAAAGVLRLIVAFEIHGDRLGRIVVGAIELLAGIVIIANPNIRLATLAVLVGISFILNAIALIVLAIAMRGLKHVDVQQLST